eukprot:s1182_g16.t1
MGEIAALPLSALLSVHLLARDLYALTAGASIQTRDTGEEYTASLELPESLRSHLEALKEECPDVLAMICRLVARCVYLAVDLPVAILASEDDEPKDPHPLASLVKEMDIVDELEAVCEGKGEHVKQLLLQPVPTDLKCWSAWKEGHVIAALKEYSSFWSQVRGPFLAAPSTGTSMAADPAVAGGMVKGWVSVEWRQPTFGTASAKKATRMSAVAQDPQQAEGSHSDSSDSDDDEWELISGTKTPDSADRNDRTAPAQLGSRPPQVAQGVHQALELQGVVIRNEVAESLALAWENENDMGEDEKANKEQAFDEFLQGIAGVSIDWGNNLTLYALAHYYHREICVLTDNVINPWLRIEPTFGNPIHVVFYAELHYDAVQIRA